MVLRLVFCWLFAACCSRVYSEDISSLGPPVRHLCLVMNLMKQHSILIWGVGINEKMQNTGEIVPTRKRISRFVMVFSSSQRRESPPITGKTWTLKTFNYSSGGIHTHGEFAARKTICISNFAASYRATMVVTGPFGQCPTRWVLEARRPARN